MKNKYSLNEETIKYISKLKKEPSWIREYRLDSLRKFKESKLPSWGLDLSELDLNNISYYTKGENVSENVEKELEKYYEEIGVPSYERKKLSGVSRQKDSEIIYSKIQRKYSKQGVIFCSIEEGLSKHEDIFKENFGKLVSNDDNIFASLNSAFWSGGTFIYIPKGIHIEIPVQTYFRIDTDALGQFERTLIICDEDSSIHYIEGCTAPQYISTSLHAGVVEVFVKRNARVKYSSIQNWSKNIFNLVTKRAVTQDNAIMEWEDFNIGSKITMKYPCTILSGDNSKSTLHSLNIADKDQVIDSGGKMIHLGRNTKSNIFSKSISKGNGVSNFRGLSKITISAKNSISHIQCDSLIIDKQAKSNAYPTDIVENSSSYIEHEAKISSISEKEIEYLISKGFSETKARDLIVQGFAKDISKLLLDEYYVELQKILYILNSK